jgi:glucosamine-6-phosphate deaminase
VKIYSFKTAGDTSAAVAARIAAAVRTLPHIVLGLPTGRTPIGAYAELRRLHAAGSADFSLATTFNLDEFVGVSPENPGSFRAFMDRHLFDGINVPGARLHFLNGAAPDMAVECARYDDLIETVGGIDLQFLGIGVNGHVAFNEPGEELNARTHLVALADVTRQENAGLFDDDPGRVPREALTMGMGPILRARAIVLMATGSSKAWAVERAVNGPVSTSLPASLLQLHRDVEMYLDGDAAARLDGRGGPED